MGRKKEQPASVMVSFRMPVELQEKLNQFFQKKKIRFHSEGYRKLLEIGMKNYKKGE